MTVITISRNFGSGGDEIADLVCRELGYALFDKTVIARAATEAGLSDEHIVDYTEQEFKMAGLLERILKRDRPVAHVRVWTENGKGVRTVEQLPLSEENALALMRKAMETANRMDNIVIVGRGGQMVLRERPGVLHVRIQAGLEERLLRVRSDPSFAQQRFPNAVEARRAAQDLLEDRDQASAGYLRRYYNVDWNDPMLYDLVINTGRLELTVAAAVIASAAREMEKELVTA